MNGVNLDPVRGQITAYKAIDEQIKALTETRQALRVDIEDALGDNETGVLDGKTVVTWRHSKKPERFDLTAFRAAHPQLAAEFTTVREAPRVFKVL